MYWERGCVCSVTFTEFVFCGDVSGLEWIVKTNHDLIWLGKSL